MKKLIAVQKELKAPKSQFNAFGKYKYRKCEDILTAVKPLLAREGLLLTITDEVVEVGGRVYMKATSTITDVDNTVDGGKSVSASAFAREDESKKGMDLAQLSGACSSYARKYSLNALLLIDDTQDADTMDNATTTVDYLSKQNQKVIMEYITRKDVDIKKFCLAFKVESVEKMPKSLFTKAVQALEAK